MDPYEARYNAAMRVAWRWQAKALEMDREMREMIEGALPSENCQDDLLKAQKECSDWQQQFEDAEKALDAITGGNADLALKLVHWNVIPRGWFYGVDLPQKVTQKVARALHALEREREDLKRRRAAKTPAEGGITGADEALLSTGAGIGAE